jgi:DNA-binding transcriptional MocR family regulator
MPSNQMRLCFATVPDEKIEPGVQRLAGALAPAVGATDGRR